MRRFAEVVHEPQQRRSAEQYVEELDRILENAVRSQLMGEVPIGVLFSGGLDSSAIACYIQRAGARLKAYNIGFAEVNEFPYARDVARKFDLDYSEICTTQEDLLAGMEATIIRLDEPMAIPPASRFPACVSRIAQDVTVVLSGKGSDKMSRATASTFSLWTSSSTASSASPSSSTTARTSPTSEFSARKVAPL